MKKLLFIFLISITVVLSGCGEKDKEEFIFVEGGEFKNTNSNYYESGIKIQGFYIGKYLVTQKDWSEVMESNPSQFIGDNLPVENVSWYDCIAYCNLRSEKEGLEPYYNIDKENKDPDNDNTLDDVKWIVTVNKNANGYRLPTESEWEYAAGGGQKSKSYKYAGSNDINEAAWYFRNAGDEYLTGDWLWAMLESNNNRTRPVGGKKANELGLYDMSGNVREWCFDIYDGGDAYNGFSRTWKGGGWIGNEPPCELNYSGYFEANGYGPDQGFRLCKNA